VPDNDDDFAWSDASGDLWSADDATDVLDQDTEQAIREEIGEPIEPVGDSLEEADADLLDKTIAGFRARAGKEASRLETVTMADCYFCVCFATREQMDAFVDQAGWRMLFSRYIDGREVAKRMGLELPPDPEWPASKRDATWDQFAMTVAENRSL
jgi:hypothetical protein